MCHSKDLSFRIFLRIPHCKSTAVRWQPATTRLESLEIELEFANAAQWATRPQAPLILRESQKLRFTGKVRAVINGPFAFTKRVQKFYGEKQGRKRKAWWNRFNRWWTSSKHSDEKTVILNGSQRVSMVIPNGDLQWVTFDKHLSFYRLQNWSTRARITRSLFEITNFDQRKASESAGFKFIELLEGLPKHSLWKELEMCFWCIP